MTAEVATTSAMPVRPVFLLDAIRHQLVAEFWRERILRGLMADGGRRPSRCRVKP